MAIIFVTIILLHGALNTQTHPHTHALKFYIFLRGNVDNLNKKKKKNLLHGEQTHTYILYSSMELWID